MVVILCWESCRKEPTQDGIGLSRFGDEEGREEVGDEQSCCNLRGGERRGRCFGKRGSGGKRRERPDMN